MNILLISTNRNALPMPVMPIGACMVAEACERAGHRVTLLDLMFERQPHDAVGNAILASRPDVVGLSVFGLQQYDRDNFGKERTFAEALEPGYRLVERFGKPIVVAELGYEGDEAYVRNWAENVTRGAFVA